MSDSLRPHRLEPTRLLSSWDFPGKSTGVGCQIQRIFPTQGSNPGLLYCRQMLYCLSHQGSRHQNLQKQHWDNWSTACRGCALAKPLGLMLGHGRQRPWRLTCQIHHSEQRAPLPAKTQQPVHPRGTNWDKMHEVTVSRHRRCDPRGTGDVQGEPHFAWGAPSGHWGQGREAEESTTISLS